MIDGTNLKVTTDSRSSYLAELDTYIACYKDIMINHSNDNQFHLATQAILDLLCIKGEALGILNRSNNT